MVAGDILLIGIASLQVLCGWAKEAEIPIFTPKEILPENAKGGLQKLVDSGIFKRVNKPDVETRKRVDGRRRDLGQTQSAGRNGQGGQSRTAGRQGGGGNTQKQGSGSNNNPNQGRGGRNGGSQGGNKRWGYMYDDPYYPMDDDPYYGMDE